MTQDPAGAPKRPRRPAMMTPREMDSQPSSLDPAEVSEVAHETAAVLVGAGRAADDPELTRRLVELVDELGMSTIAQLWADRAPVSLPGALWRLYTIREWVQRDSVGAAMDYDVGRHHADVSHAVAGAAEPPSPEALRELVDAILTGVFDGDLAVALDRAAAFCRVISIGRAHRADDDDGYDEAAASAATHSASALLSTAQDLSRAAAAWRAGQLD
ncbi:hypothetical protein [Rudaeicoccus suwonensis]|uniref:DNA-directed RNA polymerase subunit beta n=1 Tax=Rudaeicoccus suwonensis TaxID=657409 RepID=A0A561DVE9_9MICO|nr:hypothetical protein [Rudaeicoccus suwonensis]TWE07320.1 hypothetical protein BKA23_3502 [Rudaeicoccus suwonensis]